MAVLAATVCTHPHTAPIGGRDKPARLIVTGRLTAPFTHVASSCA